MTTEQVLVGMFKENTGTHILDSGGAYGRHWQRNQGKDFNAEPYKRLRFEVRRGAHIGELTDDWEVEFCLSAYHWLVERVDFAPKMQRLFDRYAELPENRDENWHALKNNFPDWLAKRLAAKGKIVTGIYGEDQPALVNTCNGEDALDQTLEYIYFEVRDRHERYTRFKDCYILLQVHGGCDIRGGYTAPKAFNASIEDQSILSNADGELSCERDYHHYWSTENGGYTWQCQFWDGDRTRREFDFDQLQAMEVEEVRVMEDEHDPILPDESFEHDRPTIGYIQIKDGKGYCPICGGLLS